jgi:sulfide:quinone oxidoreductase
MTVQTHHLPARARAATRGRRVLIAGGGVAGLETLIALRALAGGRVDIALVAPERTFVNRSMSVEQPFRPKRVRGITLEAIAAEFGARLHRGTLDRVEHERRVAVTREGDDLRYDMLVLALGARPERERDPEGVLAYRDGRDAATYRLLLRRLRQGWVDSLAFVKPAGPSWPLALYDLALMTAAECAAHGTRVELHLITPEQEPLAAFGGRASAAIRRLLEASGASLHASSYAVPRGHGCLDVLPGGRRVVVDQVVTLPRLVGPRLRGIACDRDGFVKTDADGRVADLDGVYAVGDATAYPIKQGGIAAQQADAAAATITAAVGAEIDRQAFRPILRGLLLADGAPLYLRADISGAAGDDSTVSREPLWWPPNRLCARFLAPYLCRQAGDGADVMPAPA